MKRILPTIVISQFFCTSLWFAGNAVLPDIVAQFKPDPSYLANLSSSVQLGFITGTLLFSILSISDRLQPSKVFFYCGIIASGCNFLITMSGSAGEILTLRFLTGFFLAGIYPVGMKIASDHYQQGLGRSLGFLVGALVLGTSFPHLLKSLTTALPWKYVIYSTSLLSLLGGFAMIVLVPDGRYRRPAPKFSMMELQKGFLNRDFRAAAFGYFGHMWELYAFWVFVPVILVTYNTHHPVSSLNIPLLSFCIIAIGSIACVVSGWISQKAGARKTATTALAISCGCCLISPWMLLNSSETLFLTFLFFWSVFVIADSPMFSTLVAQHAPPESKGTAITIVTCIGFSVTIVSIQFIQLMSEIWDVRYLYTLLAIGPILGLIALRRKSENLPNQLS